jgi:hypothetical protein
VNSEQPSPKGGEQPSPDHQPAVGTRGGPASWDRGEPLADVELTGRDFADAEWSFLYKARDTDYAAAQPAPGQVAAANRRMRGAPVPEIHGPFIKAPVWTWEVPLYFWAGGAASGASFMALACDLAGDHRSAALARKVALGAAAPAPLLLIGDLGRPGRFLNMLRIFKPRSPMNTGAWCLLGFTGSATLAVGADLTRRSTAAGTLGAATALLGTYLGSYTGVLLACTAVPVWARSRSLLGPIFVATATATGAAATRLTLTARGLPDGHPTAAALGALQTASILIELSLSALVERRLGEAGQALRRGRPGLLFKSAKSLALIGVCARTVRGRIGPRADKLASVMYLSAGLAFRYAWVMAGKASAEDHEAVAAMGRGRSRLSDQTQQPPNARVPSRAREPVRLRNPASPAYTEAIRRASLGVENLLRRRR